MELLGSACHYCGEQQPRRKLRQLELSSFGDVLVCREVEPCQRRARAQLNARTSAAVASPAAVPAGRRRGRAVQTSPLDARRPRTRARARWMVWLGILLVGVLVLPHVPVNGHHYRVWLVP